ncbi:MAG TPA: glycosyltransferase family 2 protein [Bellilinea sp.]|nr:glycosyltransferase family 2 protein [Bellilinea sp.]
MQNPPKISVITPSFNQAPFLEATIRSVLEQGYSNLEYIIVDGGSTDGSVDIIQRYADRLAWGVSEKDKGQTDAINKGFAKATGDILAWINSDDTYEPGAVARAAEEFTRHPEMGLIYGHAHYIDGKGKMIGDFPSAQTDYAKLRTGYVHIAQQAAFFRADLWRKVGPLDTSFYFAMDYDLWVRLAKEAPLLHIPELWANFRLHGTGKSIVADDRCWPEMLRVHYRDGGRKLAPIVAKYYMRKLAAPLINYRRRKLFKS